MSIGHRLWDDAGWGVVEQTPTLRVLLTDLGLREASRDDQVAGIRSWLATHRPSQSLIANIERHGYADALAPQRHSA